MSTKQLILHPINPTASLDNIELLIEPLREAGFLGEVFDKLGEVWYRSGINFFDFITFESSHNVVILEEENGKLKQDEVVDSRFACQIQVAVANTKYKEVIVSGITSLATCPNCQHEVEDWGDVIQKWCDDSEGSFWRCSQCKNTWKVYQLDWHQMAGFAKYSIRIESIYPESAFPTKLLLKLLQDITGVEWTYMWFWF